MKKSTPSKAMKVDAPSRAGHAETKIKRKNCEKELERVHADLCALPTASGKA